MENTSKNGTSLANKLFRAFLALALAVSFVPSLKTTASATENTAAQAQATSTDAVQTQDAVPGGEIGPGAEITESGTYYLASGTSGTITLVNKGLKVEIVGSGSSETFNDLNIVVSDDSSLTLNNVYASLDANASKPFASLGNNTTLNITGVNQIDYDVSDMPSNCVFNVPKGSSATFTGDGQLYGYKTCAGAFIGGNANEANGTININSGTWFLKSTKTGCIIGGDSTTQAGDTITINGGEMYLKGVAKGALIGASNQGKSGNVVINSGAKIELYEDFTGPAIGAGDEANAGTVTVNGGSVKTVLSANSHSKKGETGTYHDPEVSWDAVKTTNASTYATLAFDLVKYAGSMTGNVEVKVDGNTFYEGNCYNYLTNEVKNPAAFGNKTATQANWLYNLDEWKITADNYHDTAYPDKNGSSFAIDTNLYFPLTKKDHTITVGSKTIKCTWNSKRKQFILEEEQANSALQINETKDDDVIEISSFDDLSDLADRVNGETDTDYEGKPDSLEGKTVKLTKNIKAEWVIIIGSYEHPFKGTFDGQGYEIYNFSITQEDDDYYADRTECLGLFGCNEGTIKNLKLGENNGRGANLQLGNATDYVGAIAGYNKGTIENVTCYAKVEATKAYNVGGIVGFNDGGYCANNSTTNATGGQGAIINCSFGGIYGASKSISGCGYVTGNTKVGGIAGENSGIIRTSSARTASDSSGITGTNTSSKNGVGGIVGRNGNNNDALEAGTVDSCYFTGSVGSASQKWVGGIAGFNNSKSSVSNCYMAGTLTDGKDTSNAIVGKQEGSASNNYSLSTITNSGTDEKEIGIQKTSDELKSADKVNKLIPGNLFTDDDASGLTNNGYPVFGSSISQYLVNFNANGANFAVTPQVVFSGKTVTKPADPTLSDATFKGWYSDANFANEYKFASTDTITANTTLYAKVECKVSFNTDGATETVADKTVNAGSTVEQPTVTKKGYVLSGWYTDEEFKNQFDFTTKITANTKLYAKWVADTSQYKVTFSAGEGVTDVPAAQDITAGGKVTKPATNPTKQYYTFDKWYKDEACTQEFDFDTEQIYEATTIYAKFTPVTFKINYEMNGGGFNPNDVFGEGHTYTIESDDVTIEDAINRKGYKFEGWYDTNGIQTGNWGNKVTTIPKGSTGDKTLYAKWSLIEYTITYENLYQATNPNTQTTYTVEDAITFKDATKDGYIFEGWYDDHSNSDNVKYWGNKVTEIAKGSTGNVTIYAKWKAIETAKYKVTFNAQGGSSVQAAEVESGKTVTKPTDPTREGYTFGGWFTDAACTDGKEFNFETPITADVTLYAKWTLVVPAGSFTVTFDSQGGSAVDAQAVASGKTATKPADPTLAGQLFNGWYTDAACTKAFDFTTAITADTTLYAKWAPEKRLAGTEAENTAQEIVKQAFPEGSTSDYAVVARVDDYADALGAAGLAGALKAPVVLTNRETLSTTALEELQRLQVKTVYLIGGTGAIKASVQSSIEQAGMKVERLWGQDACDTSTAVAKKIVSLDGADKTNVIIASSFSFQDALSMSSFAYANGVATIIQTEGATSAIRSLTDDQVALMKTGELKDAKVWVAGGTGAVSDESIALTGRTLTDTTKFQRIGGETAYDTSALISETLVEAGLIDSTYITLATGAEASKGVDALAGCALAGLNKGPILLVSANAANEAEDYTAFNNFTTKYKSSIKNAFILGGESVMPSNTIGVKVDSLFATTETAK